MATGILEVMLVNATDLQGHDAFTVVDPYVLVQYKSQQKKSRVIRAPLLRRLPWNPINSVSEDIIAVWNEKIPVKVEYPEADKDYKLILKLMEEDFLTADDELGQVKIDIRDLLARGVYNGRAELPPQKYNVLSCNSRYRGQLQVGLTFTDKVD